MANHRVRGIHCGPAAPLQVTAWLLAIVLVLAVLSALSFGGDAA